MFLGDKSGPIHGLQTVIILFGVGAYSVFMLIRLVNSFLFLVIVTHLDGLSLKTTITVIMSKR